MEIGRTKFAASLIVALTLSAPTALPAPATKLSGSIAGYVRSASGVPQMGATVLLFNRSERLVQQVLTNERGIFGFDALRPDTYSIRVSLASFMPAVKHSILVQPGMQSLLYVDLASILSSIELVYAAPGQGGLMSDDWKWTLRGAAATRSVLRVLPEEVSASDTNRRVGAVSGMFSETRGIFNVSAGDPGSLGSASSQADLGTAFAVATSFLGHNQLQVSGNVGYNQGTAMPSAGFRTSYSRDGAGPEIAMTVQQVYLPARPGLNVTGGQPEGTPALRNVSLTMHDSMALTDKLRLDYGGSLDSLSFLGTLDYSNKFGRLTYDLGHNSSLRIAFSSGAPPAELMAPAHGGEGEVRDSDAELAEGVAALSQLPRLSLLDRRAALQRTQNVEVGYEKRLSSTIFDLSVYRESVTNAAMTMVAPDGAFAGGDLLPDISSKSSIVDAGSYERSGFAGAVNQALGDRLILGASFGRSGALALNGNSPVSTGDELRTHLAGTQRFWVSARASARLPGSGTVVNASYQWMDYSAIMPDHFYLTQNNYPEAGLNIQVRQPIPAFPGMPGRLEATAELRNGLAQGYLPVSHVGQQILLIQTPRSLRGGLSFIF
ncbi:MAG TPA: carboxypeptidase-like regulatory domain-containing protein [Bryobacteraceae bacterium]|nr:carboxypeptidase-like regulatory domain-containing protein [Bryobacteraceae bacterium]